MYSKQAVFIVVGSTNNHYKVRLSKSGHKCGCRDFRIRSTPLPSDVQTRFCHLFLISNQDEKSASGRPGLHILTFAFSEGKPDHANTCAYWCRALELKDIRQDGTHSLQGWVEWARVVSVRVSSARDNARGSGTERLRTTSTRKQQARGGDDTQLQVCEARRATQAQALAGAEGERARGRRGPQLLAAPPAAAGERPASASPPPRLPASPPRVPRRSALGAASTARGLCCSRGRRGRGFTKPIETRIC